MDKNKNISAKDTGKTGGPAFYNDQLGENASNSGGGKCGIDKKSGKK